MSFFRYKLLTEQGSIDKGVVELPFITLPSAHRYLERQGGVILEVRRLGPLSTLLTRIVTTLFRRVKRTELAEFFKNLSMMQAAGVPVLTSLRELESDTRNPVLAMTIKLIATDISSGQTFSKAVSRHEKIFPGIVRQMIEIGEETGRLDIMLKRCADHLMHIDEILSSTKRALLYPSILMVLAFGAAIFWFSYVVPRIVSLFYDMNVALPWITKVLIMIADFVQNSLGWILLGLLVGVGILVLLRQRSLRVRYYTDLLVLRIPVLSRILEASYIARITEYLGIMIGAGISIMRSLEMLTESTRNMVYQQRLVLVQEGIRGGNTLSHSLRTTQALHPFAIRMIAVGEQTGRIEEQTAFVAKVYRDRLGALVEVLSKSLEPALLIFLGGLFVMIIVGLLLPIYDLMGGL